MKTLLALIGAVVLPGTMASLGEDPADEDVLIGFGGTVIGCVVLTMTAFLLTVGGCLCCSEERLKVYRILTDFYENSSMIMPQHSRRVRLGLSSASFGCECGG